VGDGNGRRFEGVKPSDGRLTPIKPVRPKSSEFDMALEAPLRCVLWRGFVFIYRQPDWGSAVEHVAEHEVADEDLGEGAEHAND
jgi:hypothetical protein